MPVYVNTNFESNKEQKARQRAQYRNGNRKNKRSSSTPGSSKGENCQATKWDKFFAKRSRSYKYAGYAEWCKGHQCSSGPKY